LFDIFLIIIQNRNKQGWSPLAEAVSYGNREVIELIVYYRRQQMKSRLLSTIPKMFEQLEQVFFFFFLI